MSPLAGELLRKSVHIGMGGFAFVLRWLTPAQAMLCAGVALVFNLLLLHRVTGRALLRDGERPRGFSIGIALYPAVVLALLLVFRERLELAAAVWALLAFGDGMATVSGVLLRGPRLPWNRQKSWAGLIAFVLWGTAMSAALVRWTQAAIRDGALGAADVDWIGASFLETSRVVAVVPDGAMLILGCLVAAVIAALAESLDTGIDDNLLVPAVGGAVLWTATLVEPHRLVEAADLLGHNLAWGASVNAVLAIAAYAARGVGPSGAIWGWVLGTTLYTFAGWPGFLMLLLFFVLGTGTTRLGYARKVELGIAQERGGRRGARNAFANTATGVLFAFLAVATASPELCAVALVAAFATATCDTVSSEVGQAYGRRHLLITSFRRVRAGTDGAVSLEGTAAGLVGGATVAAVGWGVGLVGPAAAVIATIAAFVGATVESYLGATIGGVKRIDNELINFANTLIGALVACGLFLLFLG